MAISIDYSTFTINIPKADTLLVDAGPPEIRSLDINTFRLALNDLMDDDEGMPFTTNHEHTAPKTISGVTLARVVEILSPYTLTFEDGTYNVNIVGGNSNLSDKTNKNSVGINTANSAGLQDPFSLQAAAFDGVVTVDTSSSFAGTQFPFGTRAFPVNNMTDALAIATVRGIGTFQIIGTLTLGTGDFSNGFTFQGDNAVTSVVILDTATNVTNCTFRTLSVSGVLDGGNVLEFCDVGSMTMFEGEMRGCGITGPVALGAGATAAFTDCHSQIAGGGPTALPTIDFGGAVGTDLIIRDWHGGLQLENLTDASVVASVDMSSGRVIVDSTVSAGTVVIRGIADVLDNSTGTAAVNDATITKRLAGARYAGAVHIDTKGGTAGSEVGVNGTTDNPVDNLADAVLLAAATGLRKYNIIGNITLTDAHDDWVFQGAAAESAVNIAGQDVADSLFVRCQLSGAIGIGPIRAEQCVLDGLTDLSGVARECGFLNSTTFAAAGATLIACTSEIAAPGIPVFDLAGVASLNVRAYSGGVDLRNVSGVGQNATIELVAGQVILAATCTSGTIRLSGVGDIIDNSAGSTVLKNSFLNNTLAEADHVFDKSTGLLHFYERGTTNDIIPPKNVLGEAQTTDASITQ